MSPVHKQVKKRASEQQQVREDPKEVRPVLRQKKEDSDQEKSNQRRMKPSALAAPGRMVRFHLFLLG